MPNCSQNPSSAASITFETHSRQFNKKSVQKFLYTFLFRPEQVPFCITFVFDHVLQ